MSKTRFDRILALIGLPPQNLRTKEGRRLKAWSEVTALSLDEACKAFTAFDSFAELIETAKTSGYRPTLRTSVTHTSVYGFRKAFLAIKIADAYDAAMVALGDERRAWRGN
jgi:hypothetical protein